MKKRNVVVLCSMGLFLGVTNAYASGEEYFQVQSENDFRECISENNVCELASDLTLSSRFTIENEVILDLKGFAITPAPDLKLNSGMIKVGYGAKLTVLDTKGNGKISTGDSGNVWGGIELGEGTYNNAPALLIVNGGTIEGYYYGIVGNGKVPNTSLIINGGNIKALNPDDSVGIYQPQIGKMEINNGVISGATGIEIRSGDLVINGGNITGFAKKFTKTANKNGTTINGAGVAIAQHTTQNDVNVTINNGNISGLYALYEWNPHKNKDINKVKIAIHNGDFKTLEDKGEAVYSEDFTKFIFGGKFNSDVSKYTVQNAKTTMKTIDVTEDNSNSKKYNIFVTVVILISTIAGFIFYRYFQNNIKRRVIKI